MCFKTQLLVLSKSLSQVSSQPRVFKHLSQEKPGKSLLLIFSQLLSSMLKDAGTHWNKSFLLSIRVYEGSSSADSIWEKLLLLRRSRGATFIIIFLSVIIPQGNSHSCGLHTDLEPQKWLFWDSFP